jgi:cytochrome c-type biogenesis protein CcmH
MLFWLICAGLTAAVLYAVIRPLLAHRTQGAASSAATLAVYRDQLCEIESDLARGVLEPTEASAARVEIARRLLTLPDNADLAGVSGASRDGAIRIALAAIVAGVPLATAALYMGLGAPGLPDQSVAALGGRAVEANSVGELVAKVESRLRAQPEDGQGWDVIAPVYMRQGRYAEAVQAFARSLRLLGETQKRLAGFAEATVLAANGIVTEEARRAYERMLVLEPARAEPRFWLALAKEQDGALAAAAEDYGNLLADAPADVAWRRAVEARLRDVRDRLAARDSESSGNASEPAGGAEEAFPDDPPRMTGMVDSLAARLRSDGRDLAGWQRLLQGYVVLGQRDKATRALSDARRALADDSTALAQLEALAASLGLGS